MEGNRRFLLERDRAGEGPEDLLHHARIDHLAGELSQAVHGVDITGVGIETADDLLADLDQALG